MQNKNNATCSICGKGYYMCQSCSEQRRNSPWKLYTDTSEHYKIYQILHGFTIGVYTKQEAREKLSKIDLSDKESFRNEISKQIDAIMNSDSEFVQINRNRQNFKKEHNRKN